ncbi:Xylose isomerase-like TIM barrel [Planctomycetes bacterium Pan216]|uniref:Xylose isomerase-like TIM barrel n=1 Tax=Kolteria novifilia TaxID=2527975 RepID=A0A518AZT6_9BACT|nr:Xylose isomerase-like TIM barrel [Planctomycetes bacterium Pan216]
MRRRDFLASSAVGAALLARDLNGGAPEREAPEATLSFSTYGTKSLPTKEVIPALAKIGYDGVELAVREGWDTDSARLTPAERRQLRDLLANVNLTPTALMEHVFPGKSESSHQNSMERLRLAAGLGQALAPSRPPVIQTVLGGGRWNDVRGLFVDRLGAWADLARSLGVVIAIKPHRGGAMSRPADAIWLIEQLGNPSSLRMCYDYSHYAFRDMPLLETVREAAPYTAHIAVKDAAKEGNRVAFFLPGEKGTIDYVALLRGFRDAGYRGDVCSEVSGMVSSKPGYDPLAAARKSYTSLALAFKESGIPRRSAARGT